MTVARICNHATMSSLPRTIASRALAPAFRASSLRAAVPSRRAYATNESDMSQRKVTSEDAPAVKLTSDSTQIREESASAGMRHKPDYNVAVDYRSSCVCSTTM
jgi:NADH dehydrogenase (ubiquinone) Fe-S protein 4